VHDLQESESVSDHSGGAKRVPPAVAPRPKKDTVQFSPNERVKQSRVSSYTYYVRIY